MSLRLPSSLYYSRPMSILRSPSFGPSTFFTSTYRNPSVKCTKLEISQCAFFTRSRQLWRHIFALSQLAYPGTRRSFSTLGADPLQSLISSSHGGQATDSSVDALLEVLEGYDELTMRSYVNKASGTFYLYLDDCLELYPILIVSYLNCLLNYILFDCAVRNVQCLLKNTKLTVLLSEHNLYRNRLLHCSLHFLIFSIDDIFLKKCQPNRSDE
jgi:hypothetical protein